MKKSLIFFLLVWQGLLFAAEDYYRDYFLFALKKDVPHLTVQPNGKKLQTNNISVNQLLAKYPVVTIRKWLPGADYRDEVDGVRLDKIYVARLPEKETLPYMQRMVRDFSQASDIQSAELQPVRHILGELQPYVPNDPYFNRQWYVTNIGADLAWAIWGDETPGDPNVLVGVVDTGIDYTHPEFDGVLFVNTKEQPGDANHDGRPGVANVDDDGDGLVDEDSYDRQPGEPGYSNNLVNDDDENGYADDICGWDFADWDNDVMPPNPGAGAVLSHGTHVSGIIAAAADNGIGIAGISFRGGLIVTKHAKDDDLSNPGIIDGSSGILYCAKMGAKVINCSYGGPGWSDFANLVIKDVSQNYGAIVVCAAGNDSRSNDDTPQYPSDYDYSLAIASLNRQDKKAYYSNWGNVIDFSAPGGEGGSYSNAIYSTIHVSAGSYTAWQGTSMASPVAAGAFALLKAWFPDSSRSWLINTMSATADKIDDINPGYAGMLGAGRINVFNAIGHSIYPKIVVLNHSVMLDDANGDGQVSPGEQISLQLTLQNMPAWQNAQDVHATLKSDSPYLLLLDSTANFGAMAAGDTLNNNNDALIIKLASDAPYQKYGLSVIIEANQSLSNAFRSEQHVEFSLSMNQADFPLEGVSASGALAIDRLNDSHPQIVSIVNSNQLYVHNFDGRVASGFPVDIGTTTMAPIVADVDNSGQKEIVVVNRKGMIQIFNADGSVKQTIETGESIQGDVAVADVDGDSKPEIIFGTMKKHLQVWKSDSTALSGFPLALSSLVDKGVAVADMNADGVPDFIFGTLDRRLQVFSAQGDTIIPFPVNVDSRISATPVVTNTDGGLAVIIGTIGGELMRVNKDATIAWRDTLAGILKTPPALGDLDGDGSMDIVFVLNDSSLHALHLNGQEFSGFPLKLDAVSSVSPVLIRIGADSSLKIVAGTQSGMLYLIDNQGHNYSNFPLMYSDGFSASPALADLDYDGDLEIVAGANNTIAAFDLPDVGAKKGAWNTYLGSNKRTGYYGDAVTAIPSFKNEHTPQRLTLKQNYPNPFNPQTNIEFSVPAELQGKQIKLEIFNILGEKVVTLFSGQAQAGNYSYTWHGQNATGRQVASGIYFYRVKAGDIQQIRRMLLLR